NPANAGSAVATAPSLSAIGEDASEVVADAHEVVVVLDDGPERDVDRVALEARRTQERERSGPFDRLGDARALHEVEHPDPLDRSRDATRKLGRNTGRPHGEDLDLAVDRGIVDPVVEAAPFEGVVQLTGAVRGEHD